MRAWLVCSVLVAAGAVLGGAAPAPEGAAERSSPEKAEPGQLDPLGPNAACYVCHMTFVREPLSRVHARAEVSCIKCHGVSAAHANDENVGATPPDRRYRREEVDAACEACHKTHKANPRAVVGRFLRRKLPLGRAPICTDCHGRHHIDRAPVGTQTRAGEKRSPAGGASHTAGTTKEER